MQLKHYIAFHLAFIACLTSFMLGLGQEEMYPPLATMLGTAASLWITDYRQIFKIGPILSNSLILLIVLISLGYLYQNTGEELVVGIARILVFVQIVVFFREKTPRTRWHIMLISFLEAIVATVFQQNFIFAVLMVIYVFAGLSAVVLMHLEQDRNFFQKNVFVRTLFRIRTSELTLRQDVWRMIKIITATVLTGPLSLVLQYREKNQEHNQEFLESRRTFHAKKPGEIWQEAAEEPSLAVFNRNDAPVYVRWPYLGERAAFSHATVRVSGLAGVRPELYRRLALGTLISLFFGLFVFFFTPRFEELNIMNIEFNRDYWKQVGTGGINRSVGFSDEVRLGSLGAVNQNTQGVFTVRFSELGQAELEQSELARYTAIEGKTVYFRGVVLNNYRHGRWSGASKNKNFYYYHGRETLFFSKYNPFAPSHLIQNDERRIEESDLTGVNPKYIPGVLYEPLGPQGVCFEPNLDVVHMECHYFPSSTQILFTSWPFFTVEKQTRRVIRFQDRTIRYNQRPNNNSSRKYQVELITPVFRQGNQVDLTPVQEPVALEELLACNPGAFPTLVRLAKDWDKNRPPEITAENHVHRAKNLEHQLFTNEHFHYVLGGVTRDSNLDPLEDFVRKNPRGHCEYFAGTLVMMLRAVNIPARLVVGYKTEMLTPDKEEMYTVRECDAHTWVEVYIPPKMLPEELKNVENSDWWEYGGWLRLDPTPAAQEGSLVQRYQHAWNQWKAWFGSFWRDNFLNFDPGRQQEMIYSPILSFLNNLKNRFFDWQYWKEIGQTVINKYKEIFQNIRQGNWHQNDLFLVVLHLLTFFVVLYLFLRYWYFRWMKRLRDPARRVDRKQISPIEFYQRFEKLLVQVGLGRMSSETQREFAKRGANYLFRQCFMLQKTGQWNDMASSLTPSLLTPDQVASIPPKVADAYYQVRYGDYTIKPQEESELGEMLKLLEFAASLCRNVKPT